MAVRLPIPLGYTVSAGAIFDVSAISFGLGGSQTLFGGGTINGSINTTSGSKVYAGTDGGYGTNAITERSLQIAPGALCYLDVGTVKNGSNDLITVGGTLTLNSTVFHLKAPSTSVSLDTTGDYVTSTDFCGYFRHGFGNAGLGCCAFECCQLLPRW